MRVWKQYPKTNGCTLMKFRQYTKKEENKLSAKKENRKF